MLVRFGHVCGRLRGLSRFNKSQLPGVGRIETRWENARLKRISFAAETGSDARFEQLLNRLEQDARESLLAVYKPGFKCFERAEADWLCF